MTFPNIRTNTSLTSVTQNPSTPGALGRGASAASPLAPGGLGQPPRELEWFERMRGSEPTKTLDDLFGPDKHRSDLQRPDRQEPGFDKPEPKPDLEKEDEEEPLDILKLLADLLAALQDGYGEEDELPLNLLPIPSNSGGGGGFSPGGGIPGGMNGIGGGGGRMPSPAAMPSVAPRSSNRPGHAIPPQDVDSKPSLWDRLSGGVKKGWEYVKGLARKFTPFLDSAQNEENCGVVSATNIIRMATGKDVREEEVTRFAKANGLCGRTGSTRPDQRLKIMRAYGVDAVSQHKPLSEVVQDVKDHKGVIVSVNGDTLWGKANGGPLNHAVCITGYDTKTNDFIVCDSGRRMEADKARRIPYQRMVTMTGGSGKALVEVTKRPLSPPPTN